MNAAAVILLAARDRAPIGYGEIWRDTLGYVEKERNGMGSYKAHEAHI